MIQFLTRILTVCLMIIIGPVSTLAAETAQIGVLAYRGNEEVGTKWLGLKQYLDQSVEGWEFELVPITLGSAHAMIENGALDFIVTNPGHYIDLERQHVMSVIASRSNLKSDGSYAHEFGSAIITRPDSGITHLQQVKGRSIAAIDRNAFGGFQIAWREFDNVGVDLFEDTAELRFVGFPMDQILWQVHNGEVDVGIVRSGLVEEFIAKGLITEGSLVLLNSTASYTFPDQISTRLYPEWPFATFNSTPAWLRDQVALALLESTGNPIAEAVEMTDIWTAPLSYHAVRELSNDYRVYLENRQSFSAKLPFGLAGIAAVVLSLIFLMLYLAQRNRTPPASVALPKVLQQPVPEQKPTVQVTKREQEILEMISSGHSTKEMAVELNISPKTVEFHRSNLLKKFGAKTSSQLIALAT